MTDTIQPPRIEGVPEHEDDLQEVVFEEEVRTSWRRRTMEWRPGRKYKATVGVVAVATTVFVAQNVDEYQKWESWNSSNYYPTPAAGCASFVDMERDLSLQIPVEASRLVSNVTTALALEASGEQFVFNPDVADHTSSANDFQSSGVDLRETWRQVRSFDDHHIESFSLNSGLKINVYSSVENPDFRIDHERFDELFNASLDPVLAMSDEHYAELSECTQEGFGFPVSQSESELDLYILPSTGYCIGHMRILELPESGEDEGCVSQGSTPPQLKAEFLFWDLVNEEFMIITAKDTDDEEELALRMNRILAHEAAHYWLNQTGRRFELDPEERYVEAIEETLRAQNIADINNSSRPAIIYEPNP